MFHVDLTRPREGFDRDVGPRNVARASPGTRGSFRNKRTPGLRRCRKGQWTGLVGSRHGSYRTRRSVEWRGTSDSSLRREEAVGQSPPLVRDES